MDLTSFGLVTFLVGGTMFLFGLPMIFATEWFLKELQETAKEKPGLSGFQLFGVPLFVLGLWILSIEYRLGSGMGWSIIIPILGYSAVLKGIFALWAPNFFEDMVKRFYSNSSSMILVGIIAMAMGALMWWLTFSVF